MIRFEITGLESLQRLADSLSPKVIQRATRAGIASASRAVPVAVSRPVAAAYGLPARRIREDIRPVRFDAGGQAATIGFSRRPPTLTQYGARAGTRSSGAPGLGRGRGWGKPTKPGRPLTAVVLRSDGRQPYPGAFLADGRSGNRLVFRRDSSGQLHSVYGPSIGSIFLGRSAIGPQLRSDVEARVREQFLKGFERVLASAARGY